MVEVEQEQQTWGCCTVFLHGRLKCHYTYHLQPDQTKPSRSRQRHYPRPIYGINDPRYSAMNRLIDALHIPAQAPRLRIQYQRLWKSVRDANRAFNGQENAVVYLRIVSSADCSATDHIQDRSIQRAVHLQMLL